MRHARLKVVVLQLTVVSRFGCFVFEFWVLRFRVLGASFSSLGCLRFRDLGASCFGLSSVFRNYQPANSSMHELVETVHDRAIDFEIPRLTVDVHFPCNT